MKETDAIIDEKIQEIEKSIYDLGGLRLRAELEEIFHSNEIKVKRWMLEDLKKRREAYIDEQKKVTS